MARGYLGWLMTNAHFVREHESLLREWEPLIARQGLPLATWDLDRGLAVAGQAAPGTADPVAAVRSVNALVAEDGPQSQQPARPASALLVLPNFHRLMNAP